MFVVANFSNETFRIASDNNFTKLSTRLTMGCSQFKNRIRPLVLVNQGYIV